MHFRSTRDVAAVATFSAALTRGLAPDGGLYVPQQWPRLDPGMLPDSKDLAAVADAIIAPFAAGDPLAWELPSITAEAFNFPAPLRTVGRKDASVAAGTDSLQVLELFHGPTAAFKDFGARFLAAALARLPTQDMRPLRVLVATSGDTGGAVAAAFHRRAGCEVVVLFPKGLVSPTQQQQLTCWGDNVRSFAVQGSFDDCQRLAKEAFSDEAMRAQTQLTSANSINLGRLLPQAAYYAAASLAVWRAHGRSASFVIPSGNLGNSVACVWARQLGLPIADIVLAHNVNRTVPDYLESGVLRTRPSVATLASAMDVGNPSNLERLVALFPDVQSLRAAISAVSVTDEQIRARIRSDFDRYAEVWCPHTAVAAEAYDRLTPQQKHAGSWVLVATAHPAKFREIVQPLVDTTIETPPSLARLFERPSTFDEIPANLGAMRQALQRPVSALNP